MPKLTREAEAILIERFGKDSVIALATVTKSGPSVRQVNAFYEGGAFYVLTWAPSNKVREIALNPAVAIAGDWFTAHGRGVNLGAFGKPENTAIAEKMKAAFAAWIGNGHTDLADANTCILKIELADGLLLSHGTRYEIEF
ncbi:MAG: pyridoxamine 5'-phosphate oxidase family protein [Clostridia bacterium]|nr:pyridoxamine 5'-phosphate oxidase family protein [Clostridia bacterium]